MELAARFLPRRRGWRSCLLHLKHDSNCHANAPACAVDSRNCQNSRQIHCFYARLAAARATCKPGSEPRNGAHVLPIASGRRHDYVTNARLTDYKPSCPNVRTNGRRWIETNRTVHCMYARSFEYHNGCKGHCTARQLSTASVKCTEILAAGDVRTRAITSASQQCANAGQRRRHEHGVASTHADANQRTNQTSAAAAERMHRYRFSVRSIEEHGASPAEASRSRGKQKPPCTRDWHTYADPAVALIVRLNAAKSFPRSRLFSHRTVLRSDPPRGTQHQTVNASSHGT